MNDSAIQSVHGRRVWDSRGRPTVEAEVTLVGGAMGRAIAPAGASTGSGEALDKRDGGKAFGGLDVLGAVTAIGGRIAKGLVGLDAADQGAVDARLLLLDGTPNKSRLGGNATIAVSMACAWAAAAARGVPLWRNLRNDGDAILPLPEIQIFGGGAHAGRRLDVQDFMVTAVGAADYATALAWTAEVYHAAGSLLADAGKLMGVADEGGFWPDFDGNEEALDFLLRSIDKAGRRPGEEVAISLDIAATQLGQEGTYRLGGRTLASGALAETWLGWLKRYPIVAIEDPLAEDDGAAFATFTKAAGKRVQVVADDLVVTNADRIKEAARIGAGNATLIKPNQAGTLTEAKAALEAARAAGWGAIVSARSGESEDVTIVHLALGWGVKQLKVGSFARSERMAKWNEGLRLGETLPAGFALPPRSSFPWGR
ncbi:MAG: phosphopyruvate hydratase [Alphaproteobacteria bacterium]|nr:phosphopyruvate hydratase [Alphaproteobacteria bacterium]